MTAAVCPACVAVAPMEPVAAPAAAQLYSLPGIHCAACVGAIERRMASVIGVSAARVNLSLKRLSVQGPASAEAVCAAVSEIGFEIHPLDSATMEGAGDPVGRALLLRLAVAGFAMMNVMLLSVAVWSGAEGATRDLFHLISAAIAVPTVAFSAQPFFRNAWSALVLRRLNMDVPISLAILLATGMSLFESLARGQHAYFDAALSLTFFLLIGRYLDHLSRAAARSAAKELAALESHTCQRVTERGSETVRTDAVAIGDRLLVAAGSRVPVDGRLRSPEALLDRSFLTGESAAVPQKAGALLSAGEVNLGAPFEMLATAVGEDSTLRRVAQLVETAEHGRNSYTALADRAAQVYAPMVHLLALVAFLAWWALGGDLRQALNVAIAVLIITCPCALGLAVPAVTTAAIGRLFGKGYLVKHATALERLAEVDFVLFDKTGTLSRPKVHLPPDLTPRQKGIALALALQSRHPLSQAVAEALAGEAPVPLDGVLEQPGAGVRACVGGRSVALGQGAWLGAGFAGLGLQIGDGPAVELVIEEALIPGATEALSALDLPAEIITGDSASAAGRFAAKSGLPVWAGASPEDKSRRVRALKAAGRRVLMVGDGLNDTVALAEAHASLAPATALDASRNAADVVLLKQDLRDLPLVLRMARATRRLSQQNFQIAALYNAIAIPVALAGFATPLAAAIAMSASSITVLLNAQRIRSLS